MSGEGSIYKNGSREQIDELLSAYMDGELGARQVTEVERLIARDERVAERLEALSRCRELVGGLPPSEPPAELMAGVRASLERRHLLTSVEAVPVEDNRGRRSLFVRKVVSLAAMLALVAVLGGVIYNIVKPAEVERGGEFVARDEGVSVTVARSEDVAEPTDGRLALAEPRSNEYSLELELVSGNPKAVSSVVSKAIRGWREAREGQAGAGRQWTVYCSRGELKELMAEMEQVWDRLDESKLLVEGAEGTEPVTVKDVRPEQVVAIAEQQTSEQVLRVAKDYSVVNEMASAIPGRELVAATRGEQEIIRIPKPVLTSSERVGVREGGEPGAGEIRLRLVVSE
jgi:anti-sigma-K factor RskA